MTSQLFVTAELKRNGNEKCVGDDEASTSNDMTPKRALLLRRETSSVLTPKTAAVSQRQARKLNAADVVASNKVSVCPSKAGVTTKLISIRMLLLAAFYCWSAAALLMAAAQDGSSELTPDKTVSSIGARLRVRCTDDNLRLYPNATACADEREPESCRMVFTTPASSSPAARDPKCDNPLLKDLADQCRRTCAICCEDPSYACQNDESGIVNCNQNMEKCGMAEFSQMMIKFCPATCGLCLARKCRDQIEECDSMRSLCTNEIYATFMEHQCARTCGKCSDGTEEEKGGEKEKGGGGAEESEERESRKESGGGKKKIARASSEESAESGDGPPPTRGRPSKNDKKSDRKGGNDGGEDEEEEKCVDVLKNCKKNKKFCKHPSYKAMMKQNCARTCGYCKPKKGGGRESSSASRTTADPDCKDNHPFCKGWAANGYCESDEYTEEEKYDKCAKTCGLC